MVVIKKSLSLFFLCFLFFSFAQQNEEFKQVKKFYDYQRLILNKEFKKRFDKGETNLLLGMGSFWEGADFAQQDKVIEIIGVFSPMDGGDKIVFIVVDEIPLILEYLKNIRNSSLLNSR